MIGTTNTSRRTRALCALVGLTGLLGPLAACNNDDDITAPTVGVTAVADKSFNFTTLHTFAMPDTVVQFVAFTGTPIPPSRAFDQVVLNEVRANLLSRGYIQVTDPQEVRPDFVVLVSSTATENYNAFVTYPWYNQWAFYSGWGWYAPGFSSSWNLIYPWFADVGATAYDRGTLVVTIIPTLSVNPTSQTVNASWAGIASALLNGAVTSTDVSAAVDAMFQLSPYLIASRPTASVASR
jgi:hypothetical protein